jgi:hypothetical protein
MTHHLPFQDVRWRPSAWRPAIPVLGLITIAMLLLAGCGSNSDLPPTASASGQVMYQGKPLNVGTVTFHPEGVGNPGVGLLQQDGTFTISTYAPGDGAVLGKHAVTIDVPPPLDGTPPEEAFSVPDPYTTPEMTPLVIEITEGGVEDIEFVLEE